MPTVQVTKPLVRADHGRKIKVAALLGQRFLEKIQNGGRRFTLDRPTDFSVSGEEGYSKVLLAHYNSSYLATLVTPQNCTKMLRNLAFVAQFAYLASDQKKVLFFQANRATFEQLSLQKETFESINSPSHFVKLCSLIHRKSASFFVFFFVNSQK